MNDYKCEVCGTPVKNYNPKFCCSAFDCGCHGLPTEPCICSNECWDKLTDRRKYQ